MSRVSRTFKYVGWVVKFVFTLLLIFLFVFLLWRVFGSTDPASMKTLAVNDRLYDAYTEADGDLRVFNQSHLTITTADGSRGYFAVTKTAFIPEANQIQIVLRYNNATISHLVEDYSLSHTPDREEDLFDVSLFFSIDMTPDNERDNAVTSVQGTRTFRCSSELVESETKGIYNYRKFVFDLDKCGEDLAELIESGELLAVYADVYYVEDINLEGEAYGTLFLYDYKAKNVEHKLSSKDIKNIEAWKKD